MRTETPSPPIQEQQINNSSSNADGVAEELRGIRKWIVWFGLTFSRFGFPFFPANAPADEGEDIASRRL